MRVYLEAEAWMSLGIKRVATALRRFAPSGVEIVAKEEDADLQIVHMVGDGQRKAWLAPARAYACVQYCLRTTELPNTKDWIDVWAGAKAVWSYYDLVEKIKEDQYIYSDEIKFPTFQFYFAPLGVDPIFEPAQPVRKNFLIGTSGYIAETEGVLEAQKAAAHYGRLMLHLGPNLDLGKNVTYLTGVTDDVLAEYWSQCTFIAGLRRIEGFELPVIEGLACGARPIVFNAPHYTHWFGEFAEIIPEGTPEEVTAALIEVMAKPRPVTLAERSQVARRFNWETLAKGFWEAIL